MPFADNGSRYFVQTLTTAGAGGWVPYRCGQKFRKASTAHRFIAKLERRIPSYALRLVLIDRDGIVTPVDNAAIAACEGKS